MEEVEFNSAQKRLAVVTGGNKGIGLEVCRQLATKGIFVILTARDEKRGCEAVESLKASGLANVIFHQLDVKDPASIASLADFIKIRFRKLDILVNNAGDLGLIIDVEAYRAVKAQCMLSDENLFEGIVEQNIEKAEECVGTNYYGTKGVTETFLPFLQLSDSARIVNVSSLCGQLKYIPNEKIKAELNNVECLTEERIHELLQWYLKDFKEDKLQTNGWPTTAYILSKATVNAYTRILARKFPNMRINCVHPGYVITDMTCNIGFLTPEEGARSPVMLALLPDDGPSGHYFHEMEMSNYLEL